MAGITDKEVKSLITRAQREGKAQYKRNGSGLTVSASKTGIAAWYLRYRIGGKQKEITIGQYPEWGLPTPERKAKALAGPSIAYSDGGRKSRWRRLL